MAYYEVTGKRELLDIMSKSADCIYEQFMKKNTRAYRATRRWSSH